MVCEITVLAFELMTGEVFQILNINDTTEGWDLIVLDNYQETKVIQVPENKLVSIVMEENLEL